VGGAAHFCPFITGIIPQPNWVHVPNTHAPHSLTRQSQYPSTVDGPSQQVFLTIIAFPSSTIHPPALSLPHHTYALNKLRVTHCRGRARFQLTSRLPCRRLSVQSPPTTSSANLISKHPPRRTQVIAPSQLTTWGGKRSIRGSGCLGTVYRPLPTRRL
jgi:hypothetical protein